VEAPLPADLRAALSSLAGPGAGALTAGPGP
jgi:hypothetical protein